MACDLLTLLKDLGANWSQLLGPSLVGVYVTGSVCLDAFEARASDVDVLLVVEPGLQHSVFRTLAESALHFGHIIPAAGLECAAISRVAAGTPIPHFELCTSSGRDWNDEVEFDGDDLGLFIDISICHRNGITLAGPPQDQVFASANDNCIAEAITTGLNWHRGLILDEYHDPNGQNSVLNACRAWCWLETKELVSKSLGGDWALQNGGPESVILRALDKRKAVRSDPICSEEIDELLLRVLSRFDEAGFPLAGMKLEESAGPD